MKIALLLIALWYAYLIWGPTQSYYYHLHEIKQLQKPKTPNRSISAKVSWYSAGLKNPLAYTAACWAEFPKGTHFLVTFGSRTINVICNDRGHFKEMDRFLDLSSGAFSALATLSTGIIWANVQIIK